MQTFAFSSGEKRGRNSFSASEGGGKGEGKGDIANPFSKGLAMSPFPSIAFHAADNYDPGWRRVLTAEPARTLTARTFGDPFEQAWETTEGLLGLGLWLGNTRWFRGANPCPPKIPQARFRVAQPGEPVNIGRGDAIQHFTNLEGAAGITGVPEDVLTNLKPGQTVVADSAYFKPPENPFLTGEGGGVGVTKLGVDATPGQLEGIGVFGDKQQFAVEFSRETLLTGAKGTWLNTL
jgi:hypothetical protein